MADVDTGAALEGSSSPSPAASATPAPLYAQTVNPNDVRPTLQDRQPPAIDTGTSQAPPATPAAPTPTLLHPVRRGGLAGIVDEMRDAIAGKTTSHIATDSEGNKYVDVSPLSHQQQWMRVAATAAEGAAAGLAAGRGHGMGAAGLAGFGVGNHTVEERNRERRQNDQEVNQDQLNKYNMVLLKHQIAAGDFAMTRMQTNATEQDVKFAQEQADREHALGSADLGVYADPKDFTRIAQKNPQFWKDFYSDPGRIVSVPEIGADGQRKGIHVFMRTAGVGDQVVPEGTKVHDFVPGAKPEDPPQLVERTLNAPATYSQVDTWDAAAMKKMQDWQQANQRQQDIESQKKLRDQQLLEAKAGTAEKWAQARKTKLEADQLGSTGADQPIDVQAQALIDGRGAPSQLSKRSKDYNAILAAADRKSMEQTGHPYNREMGEIQYQAYKDTVLNYSDPSKPGAQNIASFDKFLGHSLDASEAINSMRNTNIAWVNTAYNKLRAGLGTNTSPELKAAMAKLETVRKEYQSFLENNHALKAEDIQTGKAIIADNATPAQMQAALKSMAGVAIVRLRAEDFGASRVLKMHIPELVSPEGAIALKHFGYDPASVYSQNVPQGPQQQTQAPQAQAPIPQPATAKGTMTDKQTGIEYWVDAQGKALGRAK